MGADETLTGAGGREPGARMVSATVVQEKPALVFEVLLETQQRILAHLVGNVARNFVRLVPGDRVEVELTPNDPTRGRIQRKL